MTELSCFCQKSELNSKKKRLFQCFGCISVILRAAQRDQILLYLKSIKTNVAKNEERDVGNIVDKVVQLHIQ